MSSQLFLFSQQLPRIEAGESKICDFPRYAAISYNSPGRGRLRVEMIFNGDPDVSNNEAQITAGILANEAVRQIIDCIGCFDIDN